MRSQLAGEEEVRGARSSDLGAQLEEQPKDRQSAQ